MGAIVVSVTDSLPGLYHPPFIDGKFDSFDFFQMPSRMAADFRFRLEPRARVFLRECRIRGGHGKV